MKTVKLTVAGALAKYLENQYINIIDRNLDNQEQRICGGGFAIFGHGNVPCLGEALYNAKETLPLYRGQNEQSMALAAAGYAKYYLRQRFMFASASAGPGTTNLLTAASLAHANRLPLLFLCGDAFLTRLPDPVLQQLEHFHNPSLSVNEAFKSATRFWDRITHPAQLIQSLPNALNIMLDPADCGPAFISLPQDVQGWVYDYPTAFFTPKTHYIRKQTADIHDIKNAAALLKTAKKPVIIAGGGVQYAFATQELRNFAHRYHIPVVETIAGRANMPYDDIYNCGPLGTTGSNSANNITAQADVILAIGTRLQDFTTGSWTVFNHDAKIIHINVGRHDANKHQALAVIGDAKLALKDLSQAMGDYKTHQDWRDEAQKETTAWNHYVNGNIAPNNSYISYAQIVGKINQICDKNDRIVTAAGGLPAEVCANWRTLEKSTIDIEFGYSCMGYEIAGAWGARIAQMQCEDDNDTIVFVGDGSYLMMNSDIYSSVLTGKKLIIIVCDNGGFAVINKLQNNTGNESFNNLIKDCNITTTPFAVDFVAHAAAMGALSERVESISDLESAFQRAKRADKTTVLVLECDAYDGWTAEGHAWWEVGLPQISESDSINQARENWEESRPKQRKGV